MGKGSVAKDEVRKAGLWVAIRPRPVVMQWPLGPLTAQKPAMAPQGLLVKFPPPGVVFKDLHISASSFSSILPASHSTIYSAHSEPCVFFQKHLVSVHSGSLFPQGAWSPERGVTTLRPHSRVGAKCGAQVFLMEPQFLVPWGRGVI